MEVAGGRCGELNQADGPAAVDVFYRWTERLTRFERHRRQQVVGIDPELAGYRGHLVAELRFHPLSPGQTAQKLPTFQAGVEIRTKRPIACGRARARDHGSQIAEKSEH